MLGVRLAPLILRSAPRSMPTMSLLPKFHFSLLNQ